MRIKPNANYRHANYPASSALSTERVYVATIATNQPDWESEGKVFVDCDGAPELLLTRDDYTVVDDLCSYVVLYREADHTACEVPDAFVCLAEDLDHAEEQADDAYPDCDIIWVHEGTNVDDAYADWWA